MDETTETWRTRLAAFLRGRLFASARGLTNLEHRLRNERDALSQDVARMRLELEDLRTENRLLKSSTLIAQDEVRKLNEVAVRDRMRVQAETAALASRIAEVDKPHA